MQIINPFWFAGSTPPPPIGVDVWWDNVGSLLHFDGADGDTTFTDETTLAWARQGTVAKISSDHGFLGATSLFIGATATGLLGDSGIYAASIPAMDFDNGDFTIEWQHWPTELGTYQTAFSHGGTDAAGIVLQTGNGDGRYILYLNGSPVMTESSPFVVGQWNQYQLTRKDGLVLLKRNGLVTAQYSNSNENLHSTNVWIWGAIVSGPRGAYPIAGYLAECRITKGVAREWSAQTVRFGNSNPTPYIGWNPKDHGANIKIGGNNRNIGSTVNNGASYTAARGNAGHASGKFYFEARVEQKGASNYAQLGVGDMSASLSSFSGDAHGWSFYEQTGETFHLGVGTAYGNAWNAGDVIGVAVDMDVGSIWFSINNVWQHSGDPVAGTNPAYTGLTGTLYPMVAFYAGNASQLLAGFKAWDLHYAPPTGFSPWSSEADPIRDNFENNMLWKYTLSSDSPGTWNMQQGQLQGGGGVQSLRLVPNILAADVKLTLQGYYIDDGGMILRYLDNSNYYLLTMADLSSSGAGTFRIYKRVGGSFTQISADIHVSFPRFSIHEFSFEAVGNTLNVYMDGVVVGSATDSTFSGAGRIGFRQNNDAAYYTRANWG